MATFLDLTKLEQDILRDALTIYAGRLHEEATNNDEPPAQEYAVTRRLLEALGTAPIGYTDFHERIDLCDGCHLPITDYDHAFIDVDFGVWHSRDEADEYTRMRENS